MAGNGILGDLSVLCVDISGGPGQLCVQLPGGATICAQAGYEFGDPSDIIHSFFGQINGAIAPLTPLFDIIDVVQKLVECVKAIPDALSVPPQPQKIAECVPGLLEALDKILKILPPLSIPRLVKDILGVLVLGLLALKSQLQALILQNARILALATKAAQPGNLVLNSILDCATNNFKAQLDNLNASLTPLNRLLELVNILLELAGLPALPQLDHLGTDAEAALAPLDVAIGVLQTAKAAIPVP